MKKAALVLLAAGAFAAVAACGKKPEPAPPMPPPPVAPEPPPPAPPPAARPEVQPQQDEYARLRAMSAEEIEKSGLLGEVYFDFDRSEIRDADRATLAKNADALKRFDFLTVTVEGHCDERGTVEYNLALGERRARAAYDYLVSLGVPANRLKTVSYGKEVPVCQASTEECWQKNRRAHSTVTGKTQ
jgi:peptidoglycan-associated lipoprotein